MAYYNQYIVVPDLSVIPKHADARNVDKQLSAFASSVVERASQEKPSSAWTSPSASALKAQWLSRSGSSNNAPIDHNATYQQEWQRVCATPLEEQSRSQRLLRLRDAFLKDARLCAQIIVEQRCFPHSDWLIPVDIAAGGQCGGEKFTALGIRFKFARDHVGIFSSNDHMAQTVARLEIKAANAITTANVRSIHLALSALFYIRGHAVFATALAPLSKLVIGSSDAGQHVKDGTEDEQSQEVRQVSLHLAQSLHLAEHSVIERSSKKQKQLAVAADVEFHSGKDGRLYMVDLSRVLPPTPPPADQRMLYLCQHLRPELIQRAKALGHPALSADAFSPFSPGSSGEADVVKVYMEVLMKQQIPELAAELCKKEMGPEVVSDLDLAQIFHSHGVNMRYCLRVAHECKDSTEMQEYLMQEAVVRAVKRAMRYAWREHCSSDEAARDVLFAWSVAWHRRDPTVIHVLDGILAEIGRACQHELVSQLARAVKEPTAAVVGRLWKCLGCCADGQKSVVDVLQGSADMLLPPAVLVAAVETPSFIPLDQMEHRLQEELAFRKRQAASVSSIAAVKIQLLRLYQQWSRASADVSFQRGKQLADELCREVGLEEPATVGSTAGVHVADAGGSGDATLARTQKLMVLQAVGDFYRWFGRHSTALQMYELQAGVLKPLHSSATAETKDSGEMLDAVDRHCAVDTNKAMVLYNMGDYDASLQVFRSVLSRWEGRLRAGSDDVVTRVNVAEVINHISMVLTQQGHYEEALQGHERALKIYEAVFGSSDHPEVATTLTHMASILDRQGWTDAAKYPEALALFDRALVVFKAAYGAEHSYVGKTLKDMGVVYCKLKEFKRAQSCLAEAVRIHTAVLGQQHEWVGADLTWLGLATAGTGDLAAGLDTLDRAEKILTQALDPQHPRVGRVQHNRGVALMLSGRHAEAVKAFADALSLRSQRLGDTHPDTLETREQMQRASLQVEAD